MHNTRCRVDYEREQVATTEGGSIAGVSCRRRWPPPTTLALTTLAAQCELSGREIWLVLEAVGRKFLHIPDNLLLLLLVVI